MLAVLLPDVGPLRLARWQTELPNPIGRLGPALQTSRPCSSCGPVLRQRDGPWSRTATLLSSSWSRPGPHDGFRSVRLWIHNKTKTISSCKHSKNLTITMTLVWNCSLSYSSTRLQRGVVFLLYYQSNLFKMPSIACNINLIRLCFTILILWLNHYINLSDCASL